MSNTINWDKIKSEIERIKKLADDRYDDGWEKCKAENPPGGKPNLGGVIAIRNNLIEEKFETKIDVLNQAINIIIDYIKENELKENGNGKIN